MLGLLHSGQRTVNRPAAGASIGCGTSGSLQLLHLLASLRTSSLHAGQRVCVSAIGRPSSIFGRMTSATIPPTSGDSRSDKKKTPTPLRPFWLAIQAASTLKMIQPKKYFHIAP